MTSKQYLEQLPKLSRQLISRRAEVIRLREEASASGAIRYDTDKVVHSNTEARFERPTIRAVDLENTMREEYQELFEEWNEMRKVVAQITDTEVQSVVRMRYLACQDIDVIAYALKVSKKTVTRRLEQGYSEVARITGYPAPARHRLPAEERHADAKRLMQEYFAEGEQ